jgi:hypothetical protein
MGPPGRACFSTIANLLPWKVCHVHLGRGFMLQVLAHHYLIPLYRLRAGVAICEPPKPLTACRTVISCWSWSSRPMVPRSVLGWKSLEAALRSALRAIICPPRPSDQGGHFVDFLSLCHPQQPYVPLCATGIPTKWADHGHDASGFEHGMDDQTPKEQ